jgi:poly-gamma-glutamate capsule biosynthesis protein CapA/YwtB (metallophosphatase superfamily)
MAQWRSGQPQTAAADAPPPQPLAGLVTPERAAALAPTELPEVPTFTLKAVGDIILGTNYQRYRKPEDWRYFFRSIQYHLEADTDLTFGNFESTFTDVPHSAKDTSRNMTFAFRSDPWYASVLDDAGFDVLNVANNHSMDFFEQGLTTPCATSKKTA